MEIFGKTAVITGASRGLGAALARRLARRGARCILVARESRELRGVTAEIAAEGGTAWAVPADVGDEGAALAIAGAAEALAGPVSLLVLNASTLGRVPLELLLDTEPEDLERVLAVNLVGPFRLARRVIGGMALRGRGLVVQVTSDAGIVGYPRWGAYGVSKAALDQMGRIWAVELEGTGVAVLTFDPGEMDTAMHAAAMPDADRTALLSADEAAARLEEAILSHERFASGARIAAS
ncbi:MAG TPA: SDR family oxidoreductase [Thermoanaerobaculia bacterium]|nr:SDR family oxidoreductase [Thermoanaerobaculia bacterium]